jgi:hypothetical protein
MKTMQKWGWLTAGVLAAGLNASYHDGGMEWAHRIADRAEEASNVVRDLAAGRADLFLTEARLLLAGDGDSSSRLATVLAHVQTKLDRTEIQVARTQVVRVQAMSDCQQAALDRAEAERDRMEAQRRRMADQMEAHRERIAAQLEANRARGEARMARLRIMPNLTTVVFNPPQPPACPHVHVRIPRMPKIEIPAPEIHIESTRADPI